MKKLLGIKKNNKLMQPVNECYKKVKKDCIKYIKSQETSKEKFKNNKEWLNL
jgi:D-glycerate 3-kinase